MGAAERNDVVRGRPRHVKLALQEFGVLDDQHRSSQAMALLTRAVLVKGRGGRDDAPAGKEAEECGRDRRSAASRSRYAARRGHASRWAPGSRSRTCGAPWRRRCRSRSAAVKQKSPNMISTMGRRPLSAAPSATPVKPFPRSHRQHAVGPAFEGRLGEARDAAAHLVASSPMTMTRGSRAMAAAMVSDAAVMNFTFSIERPRDRGGRAGGVLRRVRRDRQ